MAFSLTLFGLSWLAFWLFANRKYIVYRKDEDGLWWNLWYSFAADWVIFIVLFTHHNWRNRNL
jgi:hypothetical protein